MKKLQIIGIIIIAVAVGAIFVSLKNTSTYANFTEASENPDHEYHVVGKLDKSVEQIYNPTINPDEFTFSMTDNNAKTKRVVLHKSKPQDFDKSEQIVLIGKMKGDEFHANDILMKCPSKYSDNKIQTN
ncbi:MAG: cytochrome c maturation protein CcmE [Bacteroidetes bacterium]|nr:cytochrome c maturation protein CcmE [Bacteroidota bacterium]